MREILFRGKRIDTGEWIMGSPFIAQDCCKMIVAVAVHPDFVDEGNVYYSEGAPVDIETVGQYTGMVDIGGKRIFEGDIMKTAVSGLTQHTGVVKFSDGAFGLKCTDGAAFFLCFVAGSCTVIGNIHNNPELMEVTNEN